MPSLSHDLLARVVPAMRKASDLQPDDVDAERARLERWHAGMDRSLPLRAVRGAEQRYDISTRTHPFPSHTIRPRGRRPQTTLYYLHGGGYVAPIDAVHVRYAVRLAAELDAEVVMPDYPLAPEFTWRDSHRALVDELAALTATRDRVVVAGDSAGGGLAVAITQTLRDLRGHLPSHLLLHAPWVDVTFSHPDSPIYDARDPWLFQRKLMAYGAWWAGSDDATRPEVSPLFGTLDGLPPALMFCGTRDLLVPGCRQLADAAAASDWSLTYLEAPDLIHVFPLLPGIPEARRSWRHTLDFLRS
ncbi:alpha/beta hydrolase [Nocardioides sp. R-C-SC26]|uniref:alpha/beta hydrolase n=1 Tax=Nocardioides sp. R-C-SC26 TaxID=2870414 RepID=UPI001E359F4C|nr:alpha/beta hydrolase [Nocardioides sp. R-C-SC26]